jgi:hypothetical protein
LRNSYQNLWQIRQTRIAIKTTNNWL